MTGKVSQCPLKANNQGAQNSDTSDEERSYKYYRLQSYQQYVALLYLLCRQNIDAAKRNCYKNHILPPEMHSILLKVNIYDVALDNSFWKYW